MDVERKKAHNVNKLLSCKKSRTMR